MTIKEAAQNYLANDVAGADKPASRANPALRELINKLIDDNVKTEFENDSYLDALTLTDVMFSRSNQTVRLLTGPGAEGFLNVLKNTFVKMLERLSARNGFCRIILLSNELPEWLSELMTKFADTLLIFRATAEEPLEHFIVCDSKMSRKEKVHAPITNDTDATAIQARVSFNKPGQALVLENYFDNLWETASRYPINQSR